MAPERPPRPGGANLPGTRNSALATAALTSVALLSQTASATPATGDDAPSRDEVRQRIDNLYDRAESDTGTFNATRAAATSRGRADAGTGTAPRRQAEPDLSDVSQQWFDAARARRGPTVPAALPAGRRPAAPKSESGPARSVAPSGAREQAALELTARPALELTAGSAPALPAAPGAAAPKALTAATAVSLPSSLRTSKDRIQRQLGAARALLTAHAARAVQAALPSAPIAAIESRPFEGTWATPTEDPWSTPPQGTWVAPVQETPLQTDPWQQQPTAGTTVAPLAMDTPLAVDTARALGTPFPMDASLTLTAPVPPAPYATAAPLTPYGMPISDLPVAPAPVAPVTAAPAPEAPAYDTRATSALAFARAQIGKPCVWGAAGPGSYDNAGLTQAAWRAGGVELPRTVPAQAATGTALSLADLRVGDLIFFYEDLRHVGLYIGNGAMIHAPGPGAHIREESVFYVGESAILGAIRPV